MKAKYFKSAKLRYFILMSLACGSLAQAGGFQVSEMSTRGQGNRNAGAAATADSASTVYFNPAGLALIRDERAEAGSHLIIPRFKFTDTGSTNAIGGKPTGGSVSDGAALALVPNNFMAWPLNDKTTVGLGLTAPYGLVTEYDDQWVGRYNALLSDLLVLDINPAIGHQLTDKLSIGAGVSLQYARVELTQALDFGTAGFLAGVPGYTPSDPAFDGLTSVKGDGWSFGFNLGFLYQVTPDTRIGVGYRSQVKQSLKGKNTVTAPASVAPLGIVSFTRGASASIALPASAELGIHHQLNDKLTLLASAQWTDWSTFEELRIKLEGSADSVQPENWVDSWRYSLGLSYRYDDKWILRAGIQRDETPIVDEFRTPRIPGDDRFWTAIGATYKYNQHLTLDFAYSHVYLGKYSIDDTEITSASLYSVPVGSTLKGDYDASADILSIQAQWSFD